MKNIFILSLFFSSFLACKEDPVSCATELPCFEVGNNNFLACYLNGEPWIAGNERNLNGISPFRAFLLNDQRFALHGARVNEEDYTIFDIEFLEISGLDYSTNIDTERDRDLRNLYSECVENGFSSDYRINKAYNNYLELIEIDTLTNDHPFGHNGFKGHFGLQFINHECKDTLTMTEGIFKIGYKG